MTFCSPFTLCDLLMKDIWCCFPILFLLLLLPVICYCVIVLFQACICRLSPLFVFVVYLHCLSLLFFFVFCFRCFSSLVCFFVCRCAFFWCLSDTASVMLAAGGLASLLHLLRLHLPVLVCASAQVCSISLNIVGTSFHRLFVCAKKSCLFV